MSPNFKVRALPHPTKVKLPHQGGYKAAFEYEREGLDPAECLPIDFSLMLKAGETLTVLDSKVVESATGTRHTLITATTPLGDYVQIMYPNIDSSPAAGLYVGAPRGMLRFVDSGKMPQISLYTHATGHRDVYKEMELRALEFEQREQQSRDARK